MIGQGKFMFSFRLNLFSAGLSGACGEHYGGPLDRGAHAPHLLMAHS